MKALKPTQKKIIVAIAAALCIALAAGIIYGAVSGSGTEVTYRETVVESGDLVVGITESGSVDIGTVEQVFELDMSALQRVDTGSTESSQTGNDFGGGMPGMGGTSSSGGALNMFDQIFGMAGGGNSAQSDTDSSLTVAEVCVSVGQQVSQGDVLYELEEESVLELEEQLESNVEKAQADLEAVYADQTLSRQTAQYTYESSIAYGDYADTEYNAAVGQLQENVEDAEQAFKQAQAILEDYKQQLEEITAAYEDAAQVLANCIWSRDNTDKWSDTYNYVYYFKLAQSAQSTADSLEQSKERLEENVEQAQTNVETAAQAYAAAKRELDQGLLTAQETLSLRQLAYDTAQETYDIALAYLEDEVKEQEAVYAETLEKWEEYSSHINGTAICAQYDGIITSVDLEEGDTIQTNDTLVTLYDLADVTITVTVAEEDMTDIAVGTAANVSLTAYPDTIFQAEVSEISDAVTDSDGNVTYEVTAAIGGDVSGLFQGMTGDITFITKETRNVLYVSNRAVIREGTRSYVKVKNEDGEIEEREITTGFSDGVNVEIVEGLSEGDVVLIESVVSET